MKPEVRVQSMDAETIQEQVRTLGESGRSGKQWTDDETIEEFGREGDPVALKLLELARQLNPEGPLVSSNARNTSAVGIYVRDPAAQEAPKQAATVTVGSPVIYFNAPSLERLGGAALVDWYRSRLEAIFPGDIAGGKDSPSVSKEAIEREWGAIEELLRQLSRGSPLAKSVHLSVRPHD